MVKHTKKFYKEFYIKQKEIEIQEKLKLEEKRMLKESAYKRRLKRQKEKLISFLGKRNWKKIKVEGRKSSYYVVDDGHLYNERGKEIGNADSNGYIETSFGYIHRLIWETFNGKIPEGYEIDHINTIRNDNRLENLRLVTHKENFTNPLTKKHFKTVDRTYVSKYLTKYYDIVQMDTENNVIAKYNTIKDIPSKYGKGMIYKAIEGKSKTAHGYIWKTNA